jgi:hypothetical protein
LRLSLCRRTPSYAYQTSRPAKKPVASAAFGIRLRLGESDGKTIKEEDLTKSASQGSINQQIFPPIPERFLSGLPEPPITAKLSVKHIPVAHPGPYNAGRQSHLCFRHPPPGTETEAGGNPCRPSSTSTRSSLQMLIAFCQQVPILDRFPRLPAIRSNAVSALSICAAWETVDRYCRASRRAALRSLADLR